MSFVFDGFDGLLRTLLVGVLAYVALIVVVRSSGKRALVYRGLVLHDALQEERVLEEELQAAMRAQGLACYADADLIVLETDGSFTAVRSLPAGPSAATDSLRHLPS